MSRGISNQNSGANADSIASYPIVETPAPVNGDTIEFQNGYWVYVSNTASGLTGLTNEGGGAGIYDSQLAGIAYLRSLATSDSNMSVIQNSTNIQINGPTNPIYTSLTSPTIYTNTVIADGASVITFGSPISSSIANINTINDDGAGSTNIPNLKTGSITTPAGLVNFNANEITNTSSVSTSVLNADFINSTSGGSITVSNPIKIGALYVNDFYVDTFSSINILSPVSFFSTINLGIGSYTNILNIASTSQIKLGQIISNWLNNSPNYYLTLDNSGNVYATPIASTDSNIYNTDGTITTTSRTVSIPSGGNLNFADTTGTGTYIKINTAIPAIQINSNGSTGVTIGSSSQGQTAIQSGIITLFSDAISFSPITTAGKTTVASDFYVNKKIFDSSSSAGTSGQILSSTGTGVSWTNGVNSYNGRNGTVVPANGDYAITQISGCSALCSTTTTVITSPTAGQIVSYNGTIWQNTTPTYGSVSSVSLTMPSIFSVSGSPITSSGTFSVSLNSELQNLFLASPSGSSGVPSFRNIAVGDLPTFTTGGIFISNSSGQISVNQPFLNWSATNQSVGINGNTNQYSNLRLSGTAQVNGFFTNSGFTFYTTGTISSSGTTVTGTGTTFTSGMVGGIIFSASTQNTTAYTITAFISATSLTISGSPAWSGVSYGLAYNATAIDYAGNVSLGNSVYLQGKFFDTNNSVGTAGQFLQTNGSGKVSWQSDLKTVFTFNSVSNLTNGSYIGTYGINTAIGKSEIVITRAGTLQNMYGWISAIGGGTSANIFIVYKNGASTALAIGMSASAQTANSGVLSATVAAGDLITILYTASNSPAAAYGTISIEFS